MQLRRANALKMAKRNMKPKFIVGLFLLSAAPHALTSTAQARPARAKIHTPEAGSREYSAVIDAAREPIRKFFKVRTVDFFGLEDFRVGGSWAHFYAQTSDEYGQQLQPDGDADSTVGVTMLLKLEGKRWRVVEWAYVAEPIEIEWAKAHPELSSKCFGFEGERFEIIISHKEHKGYKENEES